MFFKKLLPIAIFLKISFVHFKKSGWGGKEIENYEHISKDLRNNIWFLLYVFVGAFLCFLMFLLLFAMFDMVFYKNILR